MSPQDAVLVALAAAVAPRQAPSLLSRLGSAGAAPARSLAERLAASPRQERLTALATALTAARGGSALRPVSAAERPRIAAVWTSVRGGLAVPPSVSPALVRLCRERLGP